MHNIFTAVTRHYDLINHVITLGMDSGWRKFAARVCLAANPGKVLDLCCGTADLAIAMAKMAKTEIDFTGADYSQPMLDAAAKKVAEKIPGRKINFVSADAANLPFTDGYFDAVGISFAFRNLTYKNPHSEKHISEVYRVLRQEGRFVIVESSQPKNAFIRACFRLYMKGFTANVGTWLSGNKGAYHYLGESASRYYTGEELRKILLEAGFKQVEYRPLFFGAAGIHVAIK